jgi:dTDP-4-amino-4,6-dideoxygalactose transaminase
VHLSDAYAWLGHTHGDFPVAETVASEVLSLPIFPGMTDDQAAYVAAGVREFFDR